MSIAKDKDVKYLIEKYVNKCFDDAYLSEQRTRNHKNEYIDFILIKNKEGRWQFYHFIKCKYNRVLEKTIYRIKNNIEKNYGVIYHDTSSLRCAFYEDGTIDPNFTEMMFNIRKSSVLLSIFDNETDNRKAGNKIPAFRLEKLLIEFANLYKISPERLFTDGSNLLSLPDEYYTDWKMFNDLYRKTFNKELGKGYEVLMSDGIERIIV